MRLRVSGNPDSVCVKAVSRSQIADPSLLCWGDLVGTGYADRAPCVCARVCACAPLCTCMDVWTFVAALSNQPWLCLLRVCQPGVTFSSVCALGNVCVYACRAAGRESPCLHCAGELEGTPRSSVLGWVCVIVGVSYQIERGWCSTSVWSHFSNVWLHAFSIRLLHFVSTKQCVNCHREITQRLRRELWHLHLLVSLAFSLFWPGIHVWRHVEVF